MFSLYPIANVDVEVKNSEKSLTFKLDETVTVKTAKSKISKKFKIPPYQQRLLCADKKLKDHLTLSDYKEIPGWPSLQLIKSMSSFYK